MLLAILKPATCRFSGWLSLSQSSKRDEVHTPDTQYQDDGAPDLSAIGRNILSLRRPALTLGFL